MAIQLQSKPEFHDHVLEDGLVLPPLALQHRLAGRQYTFWHMGPVADAHHAIVSKGGISSPFGIGQYCLHSAPYAQTPVVLAAENGIRKFLARDLGLRLHEIDIDRFGELITALSVPTGVSISALKTREFLVGAGPHTLPDNLTYNDANDVLHAASWKSDLLENGPLSDAKLYERNVGKVLRFVVDADCATGIEYLGATMDQCGLVAPIDHPHRHPNVMYDEAGWAYMATITDGDDVAARTFVGLVLQNLGHRFDDGRSIGLWVATQLLPIMKVLPVGQVLRFDAGAFVEDALSENYQPRPLETYAAFETAEHPQSISF